MYKKIAIFCLICISVCTRLSAQQQTIGLISHTAGSMDSGYVLFTPNVDTVTYLIDKCGKIIHTWNNQYWPGLSTYLQPNSDLYITGVDKANHWIFSGGAGGWIQKKSWDNQLLWSYKLSDSTQLQHHDIAIMPNGDVLAIAWEVKTETTAIAAGRDTANAAVDSFLLSNKIVELKPIGTDSAQIVWQWHAWDHLVQDYDSTKANYGNVAAHPELINLNYVLTHSSISLRDWLHVNSVTYNPQLDQIMLSVHNFSEIWIIDHSTTTAEAASHSGGNYGKGGDLLYRWGNPRTYDQGDTTNQKFFGQHDATWIPNGYRLGGDIMVFNNGAQRIPGWPTVKYSSIDIIKPPVDSMGNYNTSTVPYLPTAEAWTYTDSVPANFFSMGMGSAQMLSNGNVLICSASHGDFFEVDSAKNKVWEYINPVDIYGPEAQGSNPTSNQVFRCTFYPYADPAFSGKTLAEGPPVETSPNNYSCNLNVGVTAVVVSQTIKHQSLNIYPDPAANAIRVMGLSEGAKIRIFNAMGALVCNEVYTGKIDVGKLNNGIYLLSATDKTQVFRHKFLIMH